VLQRAPALTSLGRDAPSALDRAARAWEDAAYERCIELCAEGEPVAAGAAALRLVRLHADALHRLRRDDEALALARRFTVPLGLPGHAFAAATLGMAITASGDPTTGLRILAAAAERASSNAEREETIVLQALAAYENHRFAEVARLLEGIAASERIAYVRRLEIEGWMAFHRLDLTNARTSFESALSRLTNVPHEKRLELNILSALAEIALETLDLGRWAPLQEHVQRLEPIPAALWFHSFWAHSFRAQAYDLNGHPNAALREATLACERSASPPLRVFALCNKALVFAHYDEPLAFRDAVQQIKAAYAAAAFEGVLHPTEMNVFQAVAECFALAGDAGAAAGALEARSAQREAQTPWRDSEVVAALEDYCSGLVADARGDTLRARRAFASALATFRRIGYHRYGLTVAQRLAEIEPSRELFVYIDRCARVLGRGSWLRQRFARTTEAHGQPVLAALSRAERDVLHMLLEGKTTQEIARSRVRSEKTVRNTISALLKAFGVRTRQALLAECVVRGIAGRDVVAHTAAPHDPRETAPAYGPASDPR
jgi:DNA-binding CsgD family transcriptional regulator